MRSLLQLLLVATRNCEPPNCQLTSKRFKSRGRLGVRVGLRGALHTAPASDKSPLYTLPSASCMRCNEVEVRFHSSTFFLNLLDAVEDVDAVELRS